MDQASILQEIAGLLEVILEETETINGYQGKIPQIELDMVLSNVRKLYQAYYDLNRINTREGGRPAVLPVQSEDQDEITEDTENAAGQEIPFTIPSPFERPAPFTEPSIPNPAPEKETLPPLHDEVSVEQPRYTIPQRPADLPEGVKIPAPPQEDLPTGRTENPSKTTLADKLKSNQISLYDKLESNANGSTLADRLHQNRIVDLKSNLGINERFLFLNELFKGDLPSFEEAIENLNSFTGYPEAAIFLNHLATRYAWNQEGEAYLTLVSVIKRRYL